MVALKQPYLYNRHVNSCGYCHRRKNRMWSYEYYHKLTLNHHVKTTAVPIYIFDNLMQFRYGIRKYNVKSMLIFI